MHFLVFSGAVKKFTVFYFRIRGLWLINATGFNFTTPLEINPAVHVTYSEDCEVILGDPYALTKALRL